MHRPRVGRAFGGWHEDPLWATVYDWTVEHPQVGGMLWQAGLGSELSQLYAAADEIGEQPAGARILDVPCGGGVALRGLRVGQDVHYLAADISAVMLDRTRAAAEDRGVSDQVETVLADVVDLPIEDASVDLVVSFTGLHCFPDPEAAVAEMARVLAPGGVLTGSALLNDTGLRFAPLRFAGRAGGLLGPGCTSAELTRWLGECGLSEVSVRTSGAVGYFRGVKGG